MKARTFSKNDDEKEQLYNKPLKAKLAESAASLEADQETIKLRRLPMQNDTTSSNDIQQPKPPEYKILDEDPRKMTRPLALIDRKAYAAVWVKVEKSVSEEPDKKGKIIKHEYPVTTVNDRLVIIRADGQVLGIDGSQKELGFAVKLGEIPDPNKVWSGKGIIRYQSGERPSPIDVFERVVSVVDRFIDFNKSLADQCTMCEMITCWILSTWFLDAFQVTGYLWITGERGSGKSDLLSICAELSYLGQFISHSGSFASLRDMADYGATLAYDDAENITYQNEKDQDKRALLLAGNHRGVTIPLKVPGGPDKPWLIRHVNAFCPKAFSAIRIPDPILASRSIYIPLVRSSDRSRVNIDPMDYEEWPCDRRSLLDDLWGLALSNLSQISERDNWVGKEARLDGRNLQPWRPTLAVAKWLEEIGVEGLYQRMEDLSIKYQSQRSIIEIPDLTMAVIQGLGACAINAIYANSAVKQKGYFEVRVSEVTEETRKIVNEQELDIDPDRIQLRIVGRTLGKLRFEEIVRPGGIGSRIRKIDLQFLVQLAKSYNIPLPDKLLENKESLSEPFQKNGTYGTNGSNGTNPFLSNRIGISPQPKPMDPCWNCGSTNYFQRPDGRWVCKVCHP